MDPSPFVEQVGCLIETTRETASLQAQLCALLGTHLCACVLLADDKGRILTHILSEDEPFPIREQRGYIPHPIFDKIKSLSISDGNKGINLQTVFDPVDAQSFWPCIALPLYDRDSLTGVLAVYRRRDRFDTGEQLSAEISRNILMLLIRQERDRAEAEQARQAEAVRAVINTLSFSELEAAVRIMQAIEGSEGLLVTGHIADNLGITRSVVVNALRKLEGAGMIESRSLGMKGTYIRIKSSLLTDELKKLEH